MKCLPTAMPRTLAAAFALVLFAAAVTRPASAETIGQQHAATQDGVKRPPNVILLVADDLGYAELGCYGQEIIRTPNVDRLAAEGMRFTQFYSGSPVCAPSRCTLMTGKHTGHAWVRNNREIQPEGQEPIPSEEVTLAELFKAQGYATGAMGKWGLGFIDTTGDPNNQGFDLFFGYNCQRHAHNHFPSYLWRNHEKIEIPGNTGASLLGKQYSEDLFAKEALQFIRDNQSRPFFLYMPFIIPHLSIQVPEESLAEYKGKIPEADYEHTGYLKHPYPRAGYAAMITHLDRDIGKIMDLVKELGLDDNTIILFTSDNGPTYDRLGGSDSDFFKSTGPLRGLKGSTYEGGIRVPLVARWPGKIPAGQTSDHIAAFWDLMPTLLEATGSAETVPEGIDGLSFAPTLLGQGDQPEHEYLYWEFAAYGGQQAVRMGNWKATRQNMIRDKNMEIELYDLATDIGEKHNVAAEHPDVIKKMEQIMLIAREPAEKFNFAPLDRLSRQQRNQQQKQ